MKCINYLRCGNESIGRSKYCSDKCKVAYNRNKSVTGVTFIDSNVTEIDKSVTKASKTVTSTLDIGSETDVVTEKDGKTLSEEAVTDVYEQGVDSLDTHHERFVAGGGKDNCLARLPANFGASDCECKMCMSNRLSAKPHIINHGAWKRCESLATNELNRVFLPGDVDYVGVAV